MIKDLCFEIIQKCPNECIFCSSLASINKVTIIKFDTFKKTLDYILSKSGVEELLFSGGEPFLNPDLFKMIEYAKSKGIRVVLFTSGVKCAHKLTEEELNLMMESDIKRFDPSEEDKENIKRKLQKIYEMIYKSEYTSISKSELEALKNLGLDKIVFDYQGSNREEYNLLMGKDNFCEVSTSIIRACEVGIETDIHFVPMKCNYKSLLNIVELLNIAGVKNLSLLNFVPQGRGKVNESKLKMSKEDFEEFKKIVKEANERFNGKIRIGIPLDSSNSHKCTAGLSKLVIKYDGTILPCPAFKEYDSEILRKNGFRVLNIYENLEELEIHEGTRNYPLCKKLYNFIGNI